MSIDIKQFKKLLKRYFGMYPKKSGKSLFYKIKYFTPWHHSVTASKGLISDRLPWMPYEAIHHLNSLCTKSSKVFEFGSGGSSLFFLSRVGQIYSVEHDVDWLNLVSKEVKVSSKSNNWIGLLAPASKVNHGNLLGIYKSTDEKFADFSFKDYCSQIDAYPDDYWDLILIDGRSRVGCFAHSTSKVKIDGYIILDNSEREEYLEVFKIASKLGFERTDFFGPGPCNDYQWGSTFFQRKH